MGERAYMIKFRLSRSKGFSQEPFINDVKLFHNLSISSLEVIIIVKRVKKAYVFIQVDSVYTLSKYFKSNNIGYLTLNYNSRLLYLRGPRSEKIPRISKQGSTVLVTL
jgi:hypothetical protein